MKDAFRFIAIIGFIAFVVWLDNRWEISPQDIQQGTISPTTMKTRLTPSAFDGLDPEKQMEVLSRIYGEPRKPLGIAKITIGCLAFWAIAGAIFFIATR